MKNVVNAYGFILEFLSTSCAITHEFAYNGISLSIFSKFNEVHS
ncbi:RAxF-45 family protein [Psychrobacillus sp.]|nr:RAxF-45 family protein [Psychrobacillus sp.]